MLLRVTLPRKSGAAVLSLNGVPIPGALHAAPDGNGYLALVSGLVLGQNAVTIAAGYQVGAVRYGLDFRFFLGIGCDAARREGERNCEPCVNAH